jgi:hypothetical protein
MDGTGLYYFNARYMDPEIGRFISRDPAMDGANWWVYCRNNPLNRIDPAGLVDRDGNGIEDEEEQQYRHNDSTACCEGWESGCRDYGNGYDNNKSGGSSQPVFVEGGSQAPTVPLGSGVAPQGTSNLVSKIDPSTLKMSQTVQNHLGDLVKSGTFKGESARPFMQKGTTLLLQEIMKGTPVKDKSLENGLKWVVDGTFRGAQGAWELVIDLEKNMIMHFNFTTPK